MIISILNSDCKGTSDKAVIDDHYSLFAEMLGKAITAYCVKHHNHVVDKYVQVGMHARFCDRTMDHGSDCFDAKSPAYSAWCDGWRVMDESIIKEVALRQAQEQAQAQKIVVKKWIIDSADSATMKEIHEANSDYPLLPGEIDALESIEVGDTCYVGMCEAKRVA